MVMLGSWGAVLAAFVTTALGFAPDDPTGQGDTPADDSASSAWVFNAARCDTQASVEVLSRPKWIRHKVVSRETLDEIAFRYGTSPWELRAWNNLEPKTRRVKRGRRLRVKARRLAPRRELSTHTVVEGDSWGSIAQQLGVDASDLRAYNWPYRGKMKAGNELQVYVDPILRDWIAGDLDAVVRRGAVGIGAPDRGRLLNGVRIPEGTGYWLRLPRSGYGTTHAVSELLAAIERFHDDSPWTGTLAIGSMSGPRGGALGNHKSHQTGRDVDIRLPRREGVSRYAELKVRRVDWAATWAFVKALSQADTQVIFFDYRRQKYLHRAAKEAGASEDELRKLIQFPRGRQARRGLVRHSPGHEKHLHVRFGCGPCEVSCVASLPEQPPSVVEQESVTK